MRAALDVPMVSVLAVDDHAASLGAVAQAQSGGDARASASARFGRPHRAQP
jgi:hypothetical protein